MGRNKVSVQAYRSQHVVCRSKMSKASRSHNGELKENLKLTVKCFQDYISSVTVKRWSNPDLEDKNISRLRQWESGRGLCHKRHTFGIVSLQLERRPKAFFVRTKMKRMTFKCF